MSESTFVVLFTDYGNAEEVRKNDCLPMVPACATPPNSASYVSAPPMSSSYRIPANYQKMPYQQQNASAPYKNVQNKNPRRN